MDDWFEELTGFREETWEMMRENLFVHDQLLHAPLKRRTYSVGLLDVLSLAQLREAVKGLGVSRTSRLRVHRIVADVRDLLGDSKRAGALFQVASQFNLLEMSHPDVTPEMGVTRYAADHTQGPACAIAVGAATIYRNYFLPFVGGLGQTSARQIDCLAGVGELLGNSDGRLWRMQNGYALCSMEGLRHIDDLLADATAEDMDRLRSALSIGLLCDAEVTRGRQTGHKVSQAFCSALPIAYTGLPSAPWRRFARLVLDAAYEATLSAALLNAGRTGCRDVYLTAVGGGVFGNSLEWIAAAMQRAFDVHRDADLSVHIVSYQAEPHIFRSLA